MDGLNKTGKGKNREEMKSKRVKILGRKHSDDTTYWFDMLKMVNLAFQKII
ncbi:hypothetical protein JHU04_001244 [Brenneria sp. 4F2]|nr:hypothetical protein [Brenneria bubanii]